MSEAASEEIALPTAAECDERCQQFAAISGTDEACAHFFLQDCGWKLERFFEQSEMERHYTAAAEERANSDTAAAAPVVSDVFRLLSWNIDGLDEGNRVTRFKAVCTILLQERPEIVFLQEVIEEAVPLLDGYLDSVYVQVSGRNPTTPEPYFTMMLLRRDRVRCRSQQVTPFPTSDMGRTLLSVDADVDGGAPMLLMTAHLESMKDHSAERSKQLRHCLDAALAADAGQTVVFAGDLNLRDQELSAIGGLPSRLADAWEACGAKQFTRYTWDCAKNDNKTFEAFKPRCRFDRLFFARDGAARPTDFMLVGMERIRTSQCFPSDHWGILCTFKLQPNR